VEIDSGADHVVVTSYFTNDPAMGLVLELFFSISQGKLQKHCGDCDLRVPRVPFANRIGERDFC